MRRPSPEQESWQRRLRVLQEWRGLPEVPPLTRCQTTTRAVVPKLMEKLGLHQRFREEELAAAWPAIAGEVAARFSYPLRYKSRVLTIAVSQPAVLWTLDRSKATLLARLQEKFGKDVIRDLRFQAG